MKLKKIASLALAGVMAVSMLAGCSGKGNTDENGSAVVTPGSSSIVAAFNNGQDADNDVKVTFSSDAKLDAALQKAAALRGEEMKAGEAGTVAEYIVKLSGVGGKLNDNGTATVNTTFNNNGTDEVTILKAVNYSSETYWTEADVVNQAAREVDAVIAGLKASTKKDTTVGNDYYDYTYTGNVSMVKVEQLDGTTIYSVAYTITRTGTKTKLEA